MNYSHRVFDFYLLEDRILLSADDADAGDLAPTPDVQLLDALMAQMLDTGPVGSADELFGVQATGSSDSLSNEESSSDAVDVPTYDADRPLEVVFVDAGVEDSEILLSGLRDNTADGTQWLVVRLSADEDGIDQISSALAGLSGVDAIHILSHGNGQGISLGNASLNHESAAAYAGQIAQWQGSLASEADLLIYGCDLASTGTGRALIESIATLTDADVAASDDATGHSALGGDWDLEYTVGTVEVGVAFNSRTLADWHDVLNVYTVTNTLDDGSVGSLRWAIAQSNASTSVDDTIDFAITGTGVHTINIGDALTITDTVTIDATTDDSFASNGNQPAIELDGTSAGAANGLALAAGSENSTIRGLAIQNFNLSGILVQSTGNTIAGNYIGMDADGTTITANNVSNTTHLGGIRVESDTNTIGGLSPADRNVISGNNYAGIVFVDANSNQVQGNYIGTDSGGTLDRGNSQEGIDINRGGSNIIGGSNINARNVISGNNSDGMEIGGSDNNVVQGNYIGTDYTGTQDLGNTRDGIDVNKDAGNGSTGNLIGGTGLNEGNLIFGNDRNGIEIRDNPTIENTILGNQIFGNGALGIKLSNADGVTANDETDIDSGSNNLQNFPVLTSAQMISSTDVNIVGSLNGIASSYYRIEFFASTTGDTTGYGEGQRYLGYANVTTDGSGNASINVTLTATVTASEVISGTATKSNITFDAFTDTSEFAQNVMVTNAAPVAVDDAYSTSVNTTLNVGPTTSNLANWWQFDDGGSSQTAVDSGALGNDGTLGATAGVDTDDPAWSTAYVGSDALTFDGSTDFVSTSSTVLKTASSFTMSAWFQTTTTSGQQHILWEGFSGGNGYGSTPGTASESEMGLTIGTYDQPDKIVFFMGYDVPAHGADPIYIISNSDFTDTTKFHHAAVTVTDLGGGLFSAALYVDGVLEGTDTGIQNDRSAWGNLQIGKPGANTRFFSGQIDDVRIYDTALSAAQLQGIVHSGVLQNDSGYDSDSYKVNTAVVTGPSNGTLSINADGSFSYTPNTNFSGIDSFTYQTNDGGLDSNIATVTITVNGDPVITTSGGAAAYTENAAATLVDTGFTATDVYSADLDAGTLTVAFSAGGTTNDQLTIVPGGSVTVVGSTIRHGGTDVGTFSGGTGGSALVITFNASSTPAIAQAIGRQIGYHNTSDNPSAASRTVDFVLNDGDGGTSNTAQKTINVTAVNDSPLIATNTGTTVLERSTGTAITNAMLNGGDVDDSGAGLTYTITNVTDNGTMYLAGFGALGLNDTFSQADIDAGDVTYNHDSSATTSDAFSFSLADGGEDGATPANATFNFAITAVNAPAAIASIEGSTLAYTENDGVVAVTSTLALTDSDDTNLESAVAQITANYTNGQDVLTFVDQNGISGVWNAGSGTLTLTGAATVAQYQAALRSVTYTNTSDNPSTATRTVGFTVNDGDVDSNTQTRDISIAATNDAPTTSPVVLTAIAEDSAARTITQAELLSAAADIEGGSLTATNLAISAGSGTLVDNGDGTWSYTPASNDDTSVSFTYTITDGTDNTAGTATLDINPVNDSPNLATNTGVTVAEGSVTTAITASNLLAADLDDSGSGLIYTVTDATDNGTLNLAGVGNLGVGGTFTQADVTAGNVTYSLDDSETTADSFAFSLADGLEDGSTAIAGMFNITVTPVNDQSLTAIIDSDPATNSIAENSALGTVIGITAFADDADVNDSVTYSLLDDASGRFSIDAVSGVVTVAASLDFETSPSANINVRASSTDGSTLTQRFSVNITNVNEAPTATGESFTVIPGQTLAVTGTGVVWNDSDVDGDALALILVTPPSNGTFSILPGGTFTYTPNANFFGQDSFFYRLTDGTLTSNTVQVTIDVPVAGPVAAPASTQTSTDSSEPSTPPGLSDSSDATDPSAPGAPSISSDLSEPANSSDVPASPVMLVATPPTSQTPDSAAETLAGERSGESTDGRLRDLGLGPGEEQVLGFLSGSIQTVETASGYSPELADLERLLKEDLAQAIVWTQWDDNQPAEEAPMTMFVGMAGAGMSVFSIGYVFWALRGGALMTVFASSLPAWRFIDPIAMLSAYQSTQVKSDQSLEGLVNRTN